MIANAVNEADDFAPKPRLTGAAEKADSVRAGCRRTRPPRIVVFDDNEGPRKAYSMILRGCYDGVQILALEDSYAAWQELSRCDPDLFISDITHAGISCKEMLRRLAEKRIKYPILIISAVLEFFDDDERRGWARNLNVSFLAKPFRVGDFQSAVRTALQGPALHAA